MNGVVLTRMVEGSCPVPYTVPGSFNAFRTTSVDIPTSDTSNARSSRDFLFGQLKTLNNTVLGFPTLTGEYLNFGSFARRTKIQPLDDIDMMIVLNSGYTTLSQSPSDPYTSWVKIDDPRSPLAKFPDAHGYVNSTKILNKLRDSCSSVSQYSKADIRKTMQAVTLNLKSYDWVFDIVPALAVKGSTPNSTGYYVIPNGSGDWIKTDPRMDSSNVTALNVKHNGLLLPVIRILKHWNYRAVNKPRLSSYYFETIVLKCFENASAITSFQSAVKYFFDNAGTYISVSCPDPHGLNRPLDIGVSADTKAKVVTAMATAAKNANLAILYEGLSNNSEAIAYWVKIFGPDFPKYG